MKRPIHLPVCCLTAQNEDFHMNKFTVLIILWIYTITLSNTVSRITTLKQQKSSNLPNAGFNMPSSWKHQPMLALQLRVVSSFDFSPKRKKKLSNVKLNIIYFCRSFWAFFWVINSSFTASSCTQQSLLHETALSAKQY